MKIRLGHVSNSSSSSFCIYGCLLTDEVSSILKQKAKELTGEDDLSWRNAIYKLGLSYHRDEDDEKIVGFNVDGSSIKDMLSIHDKLETLLGPRDYQVILGEDSN